MGAKLASKAVSVVGAATVEAIVIRKAYQLTK